MTTMPDVGHPFVVTILKTVVLRFLAGLCVFSALGWHFSHAIALTVVPLIGKQLVLVDDTFTIRSVSVEHAGADEVFRVLVNPAHFVVIDGHVMRPTSHYFIDAHEPAGHFVQALTLLMAAAFALPSGAWRERVRRCVLLGPALVLMSGLDVPMSLWASLWSLPVHYLGEDVFSPLLEWQKFLSNGGRQLLALALGSLVSAASWRHHSKRQPK